MSFYLSQFISYFLLPVFISGLMYSSFKPILYKQQLLISIFAIAAGATLFLVVPWQQKWVLMLSSLALITYIAILIYGIWILFINEVNIVHSSAANLSAKLLHFLMFFCASYLWARIGQLNMLSNTNVINSDMVLNYLALGLGFTLIFLLGFFLQEKNNLPKKARYLLIISIAIMAILPLSGEWMLAMVKLNTRLLNIFNLSYIAKTVYYQWLFPYVILFCCVSLLFYYWRSQFRVAQLNVLKQQDPIEKRLAKATVNKKKNYLYRMFTLISALLIIVLWWDLVASKPAVRSPAAQQQMGADNAIHLNIKKENFDDGNLHRFSWVASDGKEVRFFIIRLGPHQKKYGVVFDSCMLCGDAGYVKLNNDVICLACGVHIFIPSIGRAGGCNPIPIKTWTQTNDQIIITQKALEAGLRYFDKVLSIDVVDPINGKHLINTETDYQYQYGTKTYFFTGEKSYEVFRNDPLKYIKE